MPLISGNFTAGRALNNCLSNPTSPCKNWYGTTDTSTEVLTVGYFNGIIANLTPTQTSLLMVGDTIDVFYSTPVQLITYLIISIINGVVQIGYGAIQGTSLVLLQYGSADIPPTPYGMFIGNQNTIGIPMVFSGAVMATAISCLTPCTAGSLKLQVEFNGGTPFDTVPATIINTSSNPLYAINIVKPVPFTAGTSILAITNPSAGFTTVSPNFAAAIYCTVNNG
jgi:hypothetical protein